MTSTAPTSPLPVVAIIASAIAGEQASLVRFSPPRYPFTYAYDLFRGVSVYFGANADDWDRVDGGAVSRSGASRLVEEYATRTGQPIEAVLVALADGYMTANGIMATDEQKADALADKH